MSVSRHQLYILYELWCDFKCRLAGTWKSNKTGGRNMKKEIEKSLLTLAKKMVETEAEKVPEWPPNCSFILHQPKRPKTTGIVEK